LKWRISAAFRGIFWQPNERGSASSWSEFLTTAAIVRLKKAMIIEEFSYPHAALGRQNAPVDKIEAIAWAAACPRHRPHIRGCVWENDKPCACRIDAENE
jgi:hypothetical protein